MAIFKIFGGRGTVGVRGMTVWAQAVEEALRKDRGCSVEKETLKKERRGGKRPRCCAAPSS